MDANRRKTKKTAVPDLTQLQSIHVALAKYRLGTGDWRLRRLNLFKVFPATTTYYLQLSTGLLV